MGSGDIVVGKATSKPSTPNEHAENNGGPRPSMPRQQQMCGAMTEQGDANRAPSQPQEFVRLVGYRDPKMKLARTPR